MMHVGLLRGFLSMMASSERLHLASGDWELEVQPARGGAVTALRHAGRPVLVSPNPATADAIGAASFALLPYANRIAGGRFQHGQQRLLPRNFGDHPHPLHGIGWKRPWSVATTQRHAVELQLRHIADVHWPWDFSARQRIELQPAAIRFELRVTNDALEPAPMGVGFHPAFAACAATALHTQLGGVWLIDADSLPVSLAPADEVLPGLPAAVPALRETLVDHCFTQWSRLLRIEHAGTAGDMTVRLTASPALHFLQLYMPPGRSWFCAEPMSQMPDALNRPQVADHGLQLLAPGDTLQAWMQIAVG
jgi:aldose 1-epimerase